MQKTTYVQPISRTNFLSRVNRLGVVVRSTDLKGDVKIYDAVKCPERYVTEMLIKSKNLRSIEIGQSVDDCNFLTFWSITGKNDIINWKSLFAPSHLRKIEVDAVKKAA